MKPTTITPSPQPRESSAPAPYRPKPSDLQAQLDKLNPIYEYDEQAEAALQDLEDLLNLEDEEVEADVAEAAGRLSPVHEQEDVEEPTTPPTYAPPEAPPPLEPPPRVAPFVTHDELRVPAEEDDSDAESVEVPMAPPAPMDPLSGRKRKSPPKDADKPHKELDSYFLKYETGEATDADLWMSFLEFQLSYPDHTIQQLGAEFELYMDRYRSAPLSRYEKTYMHDMLDNWTQDSGYDQSVP